MNRLTAATRVSVVPITPPLIEAVAALHREAFRGSMNVQLGNGYSRVLIAWFCRGGCRTALAAVDEGNVLRGYALGVSAEQGARMNRELAPAAALGVFMHPWLLFHLRIVRTIFSRLKALVGGGSADEDVAATLPQPVFALVGIGVDPTCRHSGVGAQLLQQFEVEARRMNMRSLMLTVNRDNLAAIRCYEKCGWTPSAVSADHAASLMYVKLLTDVPVASD